VTGTKATSIHILTVVFTRLKESYTSIVQHILSRLTALSVYFVTACQIVVWSGAKFTTLDLLVGVQAEKR
jgi:hypothetical protein